MASFGNHIFLFVSLALVFSGGATFLVMNETDPCRLLLISPIKTHVRVFNLLDGANFTIHCKSKNNDLGTHVVGPKGNYRFNFRVNFWGTTLFSVRFLGQKGGPCSLFTRHGQITTVAGPTASGKSRLMAFMVIGRRIMFVTLKSHSRTSSKPVFYGKHWHGEPVQTLVSFHVINILPTSLCISNLLKSK